MINEKGNLYKKADAIVISTNGFVKTNGRCVMGKGCARQVRDNYTNSDLALGDAIKANGNICQIFGKDLDTNIDFIAYPVKPISVIFNGSNAVKHMLNRFELGDSVPGWAAIADTELITQSAHQLVTLADKHKWNKVRLPRVGCGAGELNWLDIKAILDNILDDRFIAVTF